MKWILNATDMFLTLALLSKSWYLKCSVCLTEQTCPVTGVWRRHMAGQPIEMFVLRVCIIQAVPMWLTLGESFWGCIVGSCTRDSCQVIKPFTCCSSQLECPVALIHVKHVKEWPGCLETHTDLPLFFANLDVRFHPSRIHVLFFYAGRRSPALFHHPQVQRESFCLQQAGQTSGKHAAAPGFWQGRPGVGCKVLGPGWRFSELPASKGLFSHFVSFFPFHRI